MGDASSSSGLTDKEKRAAQNDVKTAAPESKASSIPSSQGTFISSTTGKKHHAPELPVSKKPTGSTQVVPPQAGGHARIRDSGEGKVQSLPSNCFA